MLEHIKALIGAGRRRVRVDAERADARAEGRRALGQPVAVREYRPEEYRALCERHFARVELLGLFHARKLAPTSRDRAPRLGRDPCALGLTKPFYDRFTPAISVRDFALHERRISTRALDLLAVLRP